MDLNADWSVATTYLNDPGIDEHLRQTNSINGVSYFLTDHLGTTVALTDATGNIVEQLAYDSFGNSAGSTRTRYGYTGRERDPDTGLMYYRTRWYNPQVGRFISEDPIGFKAGDANLYAYVFNNPANFRDPTGLQRADRDRPGDIEWSRNLRKAIDRMPTSVPAKSNCCDKTWTDCWAQCIENHRLDNLLIALGTSALPKRIVPPFRVVQPSQRLTTAMSSTGNVLRKVTPNLARDLRGLGRSFYKVGTPLLVFEGFYDWGIIGSCAELCNRNPCN